LLQQSYASNKALWHQLTTAGQAQVQLFRDMQHQKTIAQVSRWQGCNSRHCPTHPQSPWPWVSLQLLDVLATP
jgi:hypothetical protein